MCALVQVHQGNDQDQSREIKGTQLIACKNILCQIVSKVDHQSQGCHKTKNSVS